MLDPDPEVNVFEPVDDVAPAEVIFEWDPNDPVVGST